MATATSLTAHIVVDDGNAAVEFYGKAFGAVAAVTMPAEDGKRLMHAEMHIGTGIKFYLCDDFPEHHGGQSQSAAGLSHSPVALHLEVPNADEAISRAVAAGAKVKMPAMDMFWGDRYGKIVDPFNHEWSFSHRLNKS